MGSKAVLRRGRFGADDEAGNRLRITLAWSLLGFLTRPQTDKALDVGAYI